MMWPGCKASTILLASVLALVALSGMVVRSHGAAAYEPHAVIRINGDSEFSTESGVVSGSGTSSDPYIISGWQIGPNAGGGGIQIWNTRAHLKIIGVYVFSCNIGIFLDNVTDVSVQDSVLNDNTVGMSILYSKDCRIVGTTFQENYYALSITYSEVKRDNNDYIDNFKNLIEKKQPWEQGWIGTTICIAILIPLVAILSILVFFRIKYRPKPPRMPV